LSLTTSFQLFALVGSSIVSHVYNKRQDFLRCCYMLLYFSFVSPMIHLRATSATGNTEDPAYTPCLGSVRAAVRVLCCPTTSSSVMPTCTCTGSVGGDTHACCGWLIVLFVYSICGFVCCF